MVLEKPILVWNALNNSLDFISRNALCLQQIIVNLYYLCLGSVSFILFGGISYETADHYSLSEKMVAALIVTGECGTETI